MEKIRFYYDKDMESLTVWFDNPEKEHICEELGNGVVLIKDSDGEIIGFEKLYVPMSEKDNGLSVELMSTN